MTISTAMVVLHPMLAIILFLWIAATYICNIHKIKNAYKDFFLL